MAIQSTYSIRPEAGRPGVIARECQATIPDKGLSKVATGAAKPQPGWAVYWNDTLKGWTVPQNAVESQLALAVVASPGNRVAEASNNTTIEFDNNEDIEVISYGHVWVETNSAVEYGDLMEFDATSKKFQKTTLAAPGNTVSDHSTWLGNLPRVFMVCVSPEPAAANDVVQLRIGGGRIS